MQCTCKDCKKREIGCHGNCKEYLAFQKKIIELNEERRKMKSLLYKDCKYNRGYDT